MNLKKRIWEIAEVAKPGDTASRVFDIAILALIFLNVVAVIVGSVPILQNQFSSFFSIFEFVSVIVFSVEYVARLWSCTVSSQFHTSIWGRIRHSLKVMSLIDLLSILPFYLPFIGIDLRSLRILRLLRVLRVAKVGRYYSSLNLIKSVFYNKKEELILTSVLMGLLLILASSILYYCENTAQSETFSSIPATMWWVIATLTSVGYGDIYPITILGKAFACIIAFLGIGMFALPTGILGAGFVEAIQQKKTPTQVCPHCGEKISDSPS